MKNSNYFLGVRKESRTLVGEEVGEVYIEDFSPPSRNWEEETNIPGTRSKNAGKKNARLGKPGARTKRRGSTSRKKSKASAIHQESSTVRCGQ